MGKIKSRTLEIWFSFLNKQICNVLISPAVITCKKMDQILITRI